MTKIEDELEIEKLTITATDVINITDFPLIKITNFIKLDAPNYIYNVIASKICIADIQNNSSISYIYDKNDDKVIKELVIANYEEKFPWLFKINEDPNFSSCADTFDNIEKNIGVSAYRFGKIYLIRMIGKSSIYVKYR